MKVIYEVYSYLAQGGFVMIPLTLSCFVMWWAISYRFYLLGGVSGKGAEIDLSAHSRKVPEILRDAVASVKEAVNINQDLDKQATEGVLFPYRQQLTSYNAALSAIVTIAPLMGLLGTVIGMIDTFDTLGTDQIGSQSMGISAGVSKALFTTQMGLVVAVPGILFKRILQRRQYVLECKLDEIQEHVLHHTIDGIKS